MGYIDIVNLICIGSSNVGKTVLVKRFAAEFSGIIYDPREECDFPTISPELTQVEVKVDNKLIELRFWDTAGQERHNAMSSSFYRNADGVLLCFDVNDKDSWEAIPYYIEQINKFCKKDIVVTMIGNKSDLPTKAININHAEKFAKNYGYLFFETSAYTNYNISNSIVFSLKKI